MDDKELFELCKETFERKGWEEQGFDTKQFNGVKLSNGAVGYVPLYTSDYIQPKLKGIRIDIWDDGHVVIKKQLHDGVPEKIERKYGDTIKVEADSLLVGLLKLVVALDDIGELK